MPNFEDHHDAYKIVEAQENVENAKKIGFRTKSKRLNNYRYGLHLYTSTAPSTTTLVAPSSNTKSAFVNPSRSCSSKSKMNLDFSVSLSLKAADVQVEMGRNILLVNENMLK